MNQNLDKQLEEILDYAEPKTPTKYWRKTKALDQIKATILAELEAGMPKEKVCDKCGTSISEGNRDWEGEANCCQEFYTNWDDIGYNQALSDCLKAIRKTLGEQK